MKKKRILVVDDDVATCRLLKMGLEKTGAYEVRDESHARRALATAREFKPDLILLDVCMPDADGGDVAFQICADAGLKHTPVVFLTSLVSERETGVHALQSGGHQFLAKPASLEKVVACIEGHLSAHADSVGNS